MSHDRSQVPAYINFQNHDPTREQLLANQTDYADANEATKYALLDTV